MSEAIAPFRIDVAQRELDDLADRLVRTRWPDAGTAPDGAQGPQLERMLALVHRWRGGYDWRRAEALLNGWGSSRTVIDGLGIHFLHIRSPEPHAKPLLMTHGWPGSILEFRDLIGPLTDPAAHGGNPADAFHLVIPTLPGFGFSDKPSAPGWGLGRTAMAWIELMRRLGYGERWFAQGGDWGAGVTSVLAFLRAPGLVGVHLNLVLFRPSEEEIAQATPEEQRMLADAARYDRDLSGYFKVQSTRPQSVAFGLADSPVGLAAWIYALFQDATDSGGEPESVIALDHILDDIMLYWLTNSGPSSARFYWEVARELANGFPDAPVSVPVGISMFPGEPMRLSRRWAEKRFADIRFFAEADRGGHFAAIENPQCFAAHVRDAMRAMT